ncbi:methyl-accepting chemotaxis protein [Cohnella fermenti]|uniref:Methyl-accepting chemotaxis protein n=1 Tax=Cohnella fermenti TaxID=2565925 RepID=A0A4V3WGA0_9BACL|nr:methyl-accepting chemotaxis protein [Cohnella fermenti]THF83237.1 methyl-accepting chemotaxis protein [Cohnella fermenti]
MSNLQKVFSNFKVKLTVAFVAILVVPAAAVGILAIESSKSELRDQMMIGASSSVELLDSIIDQFIEPKLNDVEYYSSALHSSLYTNGATPELNAILKEYMHLHPEASSMLVGTESGLFIREPAQEMAADYDPRTRDWYTEAMANPDVPYISPPFTSAASGVVTITVTKATSDRSGVVGVGLNLDELKQQAEKVRVGTEGYAVLLDSSRKYISHPNEAAGDEAVEEFWGRIYERNSDSFDYRLNGRDKHMTYTTNERTGWKIAGTMFSSEVNDSLRPIFYNTLWTILGCVVVGAVLIWAAMRSIIGPIRRLKISAERVSQGDLTTSIRIDSHDEIGALGQAFDGMQTSLRELIKSVGASAEQVSSSSEELTASAKQTSEAGEQVSSAVQEIASGAERQNIAIDANVGSLEEIALGVGRIAEKSAAVAELAAQSSAQADEGGEAVRQTVSQMHAISESVAASNRIVRELHERTQAIEEISEAIRDIASQTNLLSLNAAIEAARAGEQGKGFAVVAGAVRKLAEQSAASAERIFDLITEIRQGTDRSVATMDKVSREVDSGLRDSEETIRKFDRIISDMKETTPQIEDISATAEQIAAGIQEVSSGAKELAIIATGNAATSEQVAASAEEQLAAMEEISSSAEALSRMSEELRSLIRKFRY